MDKVRAKVGLRPNPRVMVSAFEVTSSVHDGNYSSHHFKSVSAKAKTFSNVIFHQCIFESTYFRNCKFINCDFQGSIFKDCYLHGSIFANCSFWYVRFEKCQIDDDLIDHCLPKEENLARDLVRSLRINYAQIGSPEGVNKAAAHEVELTGRHYFKAAFPTSEYYQLAKYSGWNRIRYIFKYFNWKLLDVLWGNGESPSRVLRNAGLCVTLGVAAWHLSDPRGFDLFLSRMISAIAYFFSCPYPSGETLPLWLSVWITIGRIVLTALFLAIVVKRLARR